VELGVATVESKIEISPSHATILRNIYMYVYRLDFRLPITVNETSPQEQHNSLYICNRDAIITPKVSSCFAMGTVSHHFGDVIVTDSKGM